MPRTATLQPVTKVQIVLLPQDEGCRSWHYHHHKELREYEVHKTEGIRWDVHHQIPVYVASNTRHLKTGMELHLVSWVRLQAVCGIRCVQSDWRRVG